MGVQGTRRTRLRYEVRLTKAERQTLRALVRGGTNAARTIKRAQILLAAHAGMADETIARSIGVSESTTVRVRRRFVREGLDAALTERARRGAPRKLSIEDEVLLVAMACTKPPRGYARWTLMSLARRMVRCTHHDSLSAETVRRRLHENDLKPWQQRMWCIPRVDREFLVRMEDVITLYMQPKTSDLPVVCFDETPIQLHDDARPSLRMLPRQPRRFDYEYVRRGTANIFLMVDADRGWRRAKVTRRRAASDFAKCMQDLVDRHYPGAPRIRVVLDNLSTHTPRSLIKTLGPREARRLLDRLEFHYTPKHASWLNMAEIEISVMKRQCLARRVPDLRLLRSELAVWERQRNREHAKIHWMFGLDKARERFGDLRHFGRESTKLPQAA
jgi:transposase